MKEYRHWSLGKTSSSRDQASPEVGGAAKTNDLVQFSSQFEHEGGRGGGVTER